MWRSAFGTCRKGLASSGRCDCLHEAHSEYQDAHKALLPLAAFYGGGELELDREWRVGVHFGQEGENHARNREANREGNIDALLFGQVD